MHKTLSSTKLQGMLDEEDSGAFEKQQKGDILNDTVKSSDSAKSLNSNE